MNLEVRLLNGLIGPPKAQLLQLMKADEELENKLKLAHHKEEGVKDDERASLAAAFVSGVAVALCVSFVFARK